MAVQIKVCIDWDNDYSFDTAGDDIWADVIELRFDNGFGRAWDSVADEATCFITVRNTTGKYTPESTSSLLAGKMLPQRRVKIAVLVDGTEYPMWLGWVDDIKPEWQPQAAMTGKTTVLISCRGAKQRLQDTDINLPLLENKRSDEVIATILQQVVLPPAVVAGWLLGVPGFSEIGITTLLADTTDYSSLETGVRTFAYFGDIRGVNKNEGSNAYRMILDAVEAERGKFYFDRSGKAIFWNQNHVLDYSPPTGTVGSASGNLPINIDYRWAESISNMVQVTIYPRQEGSTITLWKLDKEMTIKPSQSITFEAPFTDSSGRRAGIKGDPSVSLSTFSSGTADITLEGFAERANVTIANNGTVDAVLTALEIDGDLLKAQNSIVVKKEDLTSIQAFGKRGELPLNLKALDDIAEANIIADLELLRRKDPRGELRRVDFDNPNDGVQNLHQLTWQIGTRLAAVFPELDHSQNYIIIGEEHSFENGGMTHRTTFNLEPLLIERLAYYARENQDSEVAIQYSADTPYVRVKLCQLFQIAYAKTAGRVRLWMRKVGNPSGSLTVKLYSTVSTGGWTLGTSTLGVDTTLGSATPEPNTLLATSGSVDMVSVDGAFGWIPFEIASPPSLSASTTYAIVLEYSGSADADNYFIWGADSSSPSYAEGEMLWNDGVYWIQQNADAIFEVYK